MTAELEKNLTVYLGESGEAHDSRRVDILPNRSANNNRELSVSVDNNGVRVFTLDEGEQKVLWSVKFCELPE